MSDSDARRVREKLADPMDLCRMLGLLDGAKRDARGVMVKCPAHEEKTPSCHVFRGDDGTVGWRCYGCQATGDAITLVGVVRGSSRFADSLAAAADLAGVVLEPATGSPRSDRKPSPSPVEQNRPAGVVSEPGRGYPEGRELKAFWASLVAISSDGETSAMLQIARGLDHSIVTRLDLARAIPEHGGQLPAWARFQGRDWRETSHRVVLPVFDGSGIMRSVRAWRVRVGGDYESLPKRLPASGCKAAGLVMANAAALTALRSPKKIPCRWVFAEGEPDFLSLSLLYPGDAVVGIVSGGWTADHAKKVAFGSTAVIRTHHDAAGDKYASEIVASMGGRVRVMRGGKHEQAA